jgi:hypothetical protein
VTKMRKLSESPGLKVYFRTFGTFLHAPSHEQCMKLECGAITSTTSTSTPGTAMSVVTAWDQVVPKCVKGKAIPVVNLLSATP